MQCFAVVVYFSFFLHAIVHKPKMNTVAACKGRRLMSSGMGWGHNTVGALCKGEAHARACMQHSFSSQRLSLAILRMALCELSGCMAMLVRGP